MKTLSILRQKTDSILRKHPWVFSGAIASDISQLEDGECVNLVDKSGRFLASGHFQHGTIAVRVLRFTEGPIDQDFFKERITNAVQLRKDLGLISAENTICRLVHGEGDQLPGLIVDYYNGVAVFRI